jgi:signal peptidase I
MSKTKKQPARTRDIPKLPAAAAEKPAPKSHAFRETVESIVIAFVLAFLFRTFEAEAFVIPTGSMAPTLMGRHKDVDCPKCGYRYQVSASEEAPENPEKQRPEPCLAGMCPMCHYVMPMRSKDELPIGVAERQLPEIDPQRSYNGDRILVNKYTYTFSEPERWDVVVFKYPYDAKINFIKRLVGLPGETLRIYQGDLFVKKGDAKTSSDFNVERKPADKFLAMRQLVHDTNYDPAELDEAGWPLRWNPAGDGWKMEKSHDGGNVQQKYSVDTSSGGEGWLQYTHTPPDYDVWRQITDAQLTGKPLANLAGLPEPRRRLITDANPYNARVYPTRMLPGSDSLEIAPEDQGMHWVGDLMVEADVNVESAKGELTLELLEAGRPFRCTINLENGDATLSAPGANDFAPKAKTPVKGPGQYRIGFANYDDQLQLWVNGSLIEFEGSTAYDAAQVFGERSNILPQTSSDDLGDLAPVRIGAKDAKLSVSDMQVWRDIYYIAATQAQGIGQRGFITDYPPLDPSIVEAMPYTPSLWNTFNDRRSVEFPLSSEQYFVMGDNSAESSDARLWGFGNNAEAVAHGKHLERRLLIGKALSVYWPHSWNRIPGTPIPFPLFPNVEDMRLVR